MKKNCFTLVFLVLFLTGTFCTLSGKEVLGKEVKKKIISFGNSGFTPANVEKYLGELEEKWMPGYDGVNIITSKSVKLPDGKRLNLEWKWFSKTRFQKEWYSEEIKSLQNIHKKAKKYDRPKKPSVTKRRENEKSLRTSSVHLHNTVCFRKKQ
jgi:hypothetical protein